MKLFYSPGACSLAIHISLREAGLPVTLEKVDMGKATYGDGKSFTEINPKGYVPTLQLDDGAVLTEGVMIQQWIADQKPEKNLMPKSGSMERYRAIEWLAFVSTELHKGFTPLFNKDTPEAYKTMATEALMKSFAHVDAHLKGKDYLLGSTYSSADAYLFTVFNWSNFIHLDVTGFTNILGFCERMKSRPAVREAWQAEGLKG